MRETLCSWGEATEEWWGKQTTASYMFFKLVAKQVDEAVHWFICEDGELVTVGDALCLDTAKHAAEASLLALTTDAC